MNSISITGRATKDAEIKQAGDSQVAEFGLAMDAYVKGEKVAMFFDCSVWGKRATTAAQYITKGGTLTVIGKLMPVNVKDGRAYLKVEVTDFTLPAKGSGGEDTGRASSPPADRRPAPSAPPIPF